MKRHEPTLRNAAMPITRQLALPAVLLLALAACGPKEPPQPPERITPVTVARVTQKDLPLTESAVGQETALGYALDYDPTRVAGSTFYVRLPFPEHVASRLKIGQGVQLSSFAAPDKTVTGHVREIRPPLNATTLTRDVIVTVANANWRPLGSIRGEVTLGVRRQAMVVPEQAVVLRPAGSVVYIVNSEAVTERVVRTGIARDGLIEVMEGVKPGETVVVDGAALLTDKSKIKARAES
jgi:multidrug efflux pump subunit AcrA (membrane-fusion protein)